MAEADHVTVPRTTRNASMTTKPKLFGRDFYRAIGEPKHIVAPMVDRSEFAWRLLTRSYLTPEASKRLLAYTPMLHARFFGENVGFRDKHFQPLKSSLETSEPPPPMSTPFLDGNPSLDRPLFVQFCANKPEQLLAAAQYVAPYCDAVDLNLGCPQHIARSGHYGAFLQEDWSTIYSMINTLHRELPIPVTAKMRILDTKEKTLEYAQMILSAGASILTVHGRRREQKGHNTGLADWDMIRYLRDNLPPETVLFANGNVLNGGDIDECRRATGVDGVMSAEGNLSDPTIFADPPVDPQSREYWRSLTNQEIGGYRLDGVLRRYLDIIYKYVLEKEVPLRKPLWIPADGDTGSTSEDSVPSTVIGQAQDGKAKRDNAAHNSPSVRVIMGHLFGLLKPMLSVHTDIRDKLAQTRLGDFAGFEKVLSMVEEATKQGLKDELKRVEERSEPQTGVNEEEMTFSQKTAAKYNRPWWVAQPYIRPLPDEAIANGAMKISEKKMRQELKKQEALNDSSARTGESLEGFQRTDIIDTTNSDLPEPALVCG